MVFIGVVVSKKFSKKATQRNYIKRKIYNFFQQNKQEIVLKKVIIRIKTEVSQLKRKEIKEIIDKDLMVFKKTDGLKC
ncbi:Riibonuclease P [Candidatus Omnitrophus magneticus]|uniref:Riibonuclease P n=1 Tax=Candidatus Omnitrophus magneticus TaxID=1609969 RepID=A0A0F0CSU2_9BACT|nr:Riibonuclease P [Candidatus Omnitrophus magneticus]